MGRWPATRLEIYRESSRFHVKVDVVTPTLSRRSQDLEVVFLAHAPREQSLNPVADSSDLKVFRESEWNVRKHGYSKRRTWRKVHLEMDAKGDPAMEEARY